jgi:hypothetical protein
LLPDSLKPTLPLNTKANLRSSVMVLPLALELKLATITLAMWDTMVKMIWVSLTTFLEAFKDQIDSNEFIIN